VSALLQYEQVKQDACLLCVEFLSITQYLFYLRAAARAVSVLGRQAMMYLAAAVSDFFVPEEHMATHKIQSSAGPLSITLPETPKLLPLLKSEWYVGSEYVAESHFGPSS
jgi:phosphopantothenate-cysteine ligase